MMWAHCLKILMCQFISELYLISVTVITVSFGTGNIFLNLVKDLNKGEPAPQVSQCWIVLLVLFDNTLHSLEVSR